MIAALLALALVLLIGWLDERDGDADETSAQMRSFHRRRGRRVKW